MSVILVWAVLLVQICFELRGVVVDTQTAQPLGGVRVRLAGRDLGGDALGRFSLGLIPPWEPITFAADGYAPRTLSGWPVRPWRVELEPLVGVVQTIDHATGQPLDAELIVDSGRVERAMLGQFRLSAARVGSQIEARAADYRPIVVTWTGSSVELRLAAVRLGQAFDATSGEPLAGAIVADGEASMVADGDGRFQLETAPNGPLRIVKPGYRRVEVVAPRAGRFEARLEPFVARGIYLTLNAAGDATLRTNALRLLATTEANTLVVDVKGDRGRLLYSSSVPLARQLGADSAPPLAEGAAWLADLRAQGYYLIARVVLFKDDLLARRGTAAGLDVAVRDGPSGRIWVDGEGLGWVDPFRREVWEYNLALAREAADLGFDEVQFDYIRFPTDAGSGTSVSAATFSQESTESSRVAALSGFLDRARQELRPRGVLVSIDTFGYTCWLDDDLGIGQRLAELAPRVDYLSPMIYPSTFRAGLPGGLAYPAVVAQPYEVVKSSVEQARTRTPGGALLRPWVQYFDDYAWQTGRHYNAAEIQAQKRAALDAGAAGWLLWDPTNRYARGGFDPR